MTTSAAPDRLVRHRLGELLGEVAADLGQGLGDRRVDALPGRRAAGTHPHAALGVVIQQGGSHLGAAGIVHADKQDLGDLLHDDASLVRDEPWDGPPTE